MPLKAAPEPPKGGPKPVLGRIGSIFGGFGLHFGSLLAAPGNAESHPRRRTSKYAKCARRPGESSIFKGSSPASWSQNLLKIVPEIVFFRNLVLGRSFSCLFPVLGALLLLCGRPGLAQGFPRGTQNGAKMDQNRLRNASERLLLSCDAPVAPRGSPDVAF